MVGSDMLDLYEPPLVSRNAVTTVSVLLSLTIKRNPIENCGPVSAAVLFVNTSLVDEKAQARAELHGDYIGVGWDSKDGTDVLTVI